MENLSPMRFWKTSFRIPRWVPMVVVAMLAMTMFATAQNQVGKIDSETAKLVAPRIGAPVMHPDGTQLGEVADILFDEEDLPVKLRMRTGAILGLGQRTVELPKASFMLLRGAVVVDLPVEALQSLPDAIDFSETE